MYNLLKGKRGIIFGALDESSIAWKVALQAHEEGAVFTLSNAPIAMRMGKINELAATCNNAVIIPADATSMEELANVLTKSMEVLGGTFESTDDSDYWSREELFVSMENAMMRLNEQDAKLLTLKYYEGKSSREITAITGIPENQVPVFMQRARKRLQQLEWCGSMAA